MSKQRKPLQVSPEFKKRLDDLQREIMGSQRKKVSLRDLTTEIVRNPMFQEIERKIIQSGNVDIDLKIKLDKRFFE